MNDPLGLFESNDPLGLFSLEKDQSRILSSVEMGNRSNEVPASTYIPEGGFKDAPQKGVADTLLDSYREILGVKSAAQTTITGLVTFPAALWASIPNKGSLREKEELFKGYNEKFMKWLNTNNKHIDTADKYNEAVGEFINQMGVPLMGLNLKPSLSKSKNKTDVFQEQLNRVIEDTKSQSKPPEVVKPVVPEIVSPDLSIESPTRATMRVAEQNKKLPGADYYNNRDANVRAVEEEIAAQEARQKFENEQLQIARDDIETQKNLEFQKAQQLQIDDHPYGDVPPQFGSTLEHGRVDENGMPIRADLSMEAQNLENPLQRNLWGDELGPALGQKLSLTKAIDSMPPGEARAEALNRFRPQSRRFGGGQGGYIDGKAIQDTIRDFKLGLKNAYNVVDSFTGAFFPREMERIRDEITDPKSRYGIALMSPDEFHKLAMGRSKEHMESFEADNRRGSIRKALKSPEGLEQIPQLWIDTNDGKVFVKGHEGRHRMDVLKDMGIDMVPVMITHPTLRWGENPTRPSLLWSETYDGQPGFKSTKFPEILNHQYNSEGKRILQSQHGGANIELLANIATLGGFGIGKALYNSVKGKPVEGKLPERPDSLEHPTTPETIKAKDEIRTKLNASEILRKTAPEFSSVTTPEEAITLAKDPKVKDVRKNVWRDMTIPGINGMVHHARNNPIFNFSRYALQNARNAETAFISKYVISKEGAATLLGKLSDGEMMKALDTMRDLSFKQKDFTPENLASYNLNPKETSWVNSVKTALEAQWEMAADSLFSAGREPFAPRSGYLPGLVSGSFRTLIGTRNSKGVFVPHELVQFDTKGGLKQGVEAALQAAKELHPDQAWETLPIKTSGLQKGVQHNSLFNGFNDVLSALSKNNPEIGQLQAIANMHINEANHKWLSMDVHELHKKGIKGMTGDVSGKTHLTNAREYSKALVDFLEQGAAYYTHQKAFNEIGKVLTDPEVATKLPNTVEVVNRHVKHVKGQGLIGVGAAINSATDFILQDAAGLTSKHGISSKTALNVARGAKTAIGVHMMGLYNPTFIAMQLTQFATGATPMALALGGKLKLQEHLVSSATMGTNSFAVIDLAHKFGKDVPDFVPQIMREAYQYASDHGIMQLSELESIHRATQSKTVQQAKAVAAFPITVGEYVTRPPVFMTFVTLFDKFGLPPQENFMAAHLATQMAMGDYHTAERPKIYASLGITGEFAGALTTFKHNAVFNQYLHARNALVPDGNGNRIIAPVIAAAAAAAFFQGITGLPGYDSADSAYQWISSTFMGKRQSIQQAALSGLPDGATNGLLSASTGLDFHSRLSMSGTLPQEWNALSPHMSVLMDWVEKAYNYGKYGDNQSFEEMSRSFTPSGLKGLEEQTRRVDAQGVVHNSAGQRMFPTSVAPRTEREQEIRAMFGVRPLRETQEQKDVYIKGKGLIEREKKLNDLSSRYRDAVVSQDLEGQKALYTEYVKLGGDVLSLQDSNAILDLYMKKQMSERERIAGMPSPTISSMRKQEAMRK